MYPEVTRKKTEKEKAITAKSIHYLNIKVGNLVIKERRKKSIDYNIKTTTATNKKYR